MVFGELLEDLESGRGRILSYAMYILNFIFLALYILGTFDFVKPYETTLVLSEFILALIFLFEYISRLDYADSALKEAKSIYSIADLLSVIPALLVIFVPVIGQVAFLRSVQVLRVLRFIRVGLENDRFFNRDLSSQQVGVVELLMLIFVILTLHAGVIHGLETDVNPGFQNFGDTMYYSVVSLTTTGFGETTPVTDAGKFATSFGLIAAVTLIPWLLVRARNKSGIEVSCDRCRTSKHLVNSNYCWKCGKEL